MIDACEKARFQLARVQLFVLFLILLLSISGCGGRGDTKTSIEDIRVGTEGIVMSFLPNSPPDTIHVDADNTFDVLLEVRNLGAFPQPDELIKTAALGHDSGRVYISGIDPYIVHFIERHKPIDFRKLQGRSTINPNGGEDVLTFKGIVDTLNLNVERYEPILLVTACYRYLTVAEPPVCIDPQPYSTFKERKVCEAQDISLSSQGAPIAITKIEEEALAQKTLFKITIKNVGRGDVIKLESYEKCSPYSDVSGKLEREDIDKVLLEGVAVGSKILQCSPFIDDNIKGESGYIRLLNGEGSIVCELSKNDYAPGSSAYTTPLQIVLTYVYRDFIEKRLQIIKETRGIS